jgi:CRP-like cAMP-binding protein
MQHNINICCPHVSGRPKSRILILKGIQTIFKAKITINCQSREKDVAAAISSTPETLSRILQRLKEEKKLIWEGKKIVIRF